MATKKKTSPETEAVVKAAPATAEKKKTTTKSAKATSPAATHKTPARKPAARKAAPAATPAFDAAAHHDEIAREAYFLFLNRGAQHGHEHEDWLRAVEIVKARHQG